MRADIYEFYKGEKHSMKSLITLLLLALLLGGCGKLRRLIKKNPDNFIEQGIEDFIKETLDVDVDFTPESDQIEEGATVGG